MFARFIKHKRSITMKSHQKRSKLSSSQLHHLSLIAALVLLALSPLASAEPEPQSSAINGNSDSSGGVIPKRQYLIAPRVGRSPQPSNIWNALEEATISSPGQVQAHRGYPGPLRSSLLFLVGNRRMIGPRSSGLLPQARIGRRAAPIGLMPQPRVGRSSMAAIEPLGGFDGADELQQQQLMQQPNGQQEVAVATLSDSSYNDALETLVDV